MRLVIHMGFHKTASTYFQQLMLRNREGLASAGVWYDGDGVCGAHHPAANALLRADPEPFYAMVRHARMAGCDTVLFSSENFEALPFVPAITGMIEEAAARAGVEQIEWHVVLREPGAYFESQYAQLSRHSYADPTHMFSEVMKKGVLFMPEPHYFPGAAPYWFFCFDPHAFLTSFAQGRTLFAHDYADADPFPGWRIAERLGVLPLLTDLPSAEEGNHRLLPEAVRDNFRARMREAVGDDALWAQVAPAIEAGIATGASTVATYARVVGRRFAASHAAALAQFRPVEAGQDRRAA